MLVVVVRIELSFAGVAVDVAALVVVTVVGGCVDFGVDVSKLGTGLPLPNDVLFND